MSDFKIKLDDDSISLKGLMNSHIKDIVGYIREPFDNDVLVFEICRIIFENGVSVYVEGDYEVAYIPFDDTIKQLSEEVFEKYKDKDE